MEQVTHAKLFQYAMGSKQWSLLITQRNRALGKDLPWPIATWVLNEGLIKPRKDSETISSLE